MTKVQAGRVDGFLARPDPAIRAVLLYGPDAGLVRERAEALLKRVAGDPGDPFRVARMTPGEAVQDPARLADEAAAIAFGGGRRVVWLTGAEDSLAPALRAALAQPAAEALIVVESDNLSPRSALRRLCEEEDAAAAVPCYADEGDSLVETIRAALAAAGLTADDEAMDWLTEHLGADRRITRSEIAKLALYMGGPGRVRLADATACVGDGSQLSLDELLCATAEGDQEGAQRMLDRLLRDGTQAEALLRLLTRHFERLNYLAGVVSTGRPAAQAVAELRPKPFFRMEKRLTGQVARWPLERTIQALELLQTAELDGRVSGLPAAAICGRAVLQLARAARRG